MFVEVDAVVESITRGGYMDHFDSGEVAIFDTVLLRVLTGDGHAPSQLRIILDDPAADQTRWRVGLRVRFEIDEQHLRASGPLFEGSLRNVRLLPGEATRP